MLSDVDEIPAIQLGELTLRFELDDLDDFGREVAEKELREIPERKASAIEELRALLKGENWWSNSLGWPRDLNVGIIIFDSNRDHRMPRSSLSTIHARARVLRTMDFATLMAQPRDVEDSRGKKEN